MKAQSGGEAQSLFWTWWAFVARGCQMVEAPRRQLGGGGSSSAWRLMTFLFPALDGVPPTMELSILAEEGTKTLVE